MFQRLAKYLLGSRCSANRSMTYNKYSTHSKVKDRIMEGRSDGGISDGGISDGGISDGGISDGELLDIVRHMQTLALLRPTHQTGSVEGETDQVSYLKSAMKIASRLNQVNTEGVEPLHNLSQSMELCLRQDTPTQLTSEEKEMLNKNSKCLRDEWYITPPIPAHKTST